MNLERYQRHFLVEGFTKEQQNRLFNSSVLVAGAGGLGSALLLYLAAAGVGHLGIIDFDLVSKSNLNRQILYTPSDEGKYKCDEAAKRVKELNPECKVTLFNCKLDRLNGDDIVKDFDVVADATDNFSTRYILDDICFKMRKPLVYGTAEQWGGQVSVFHYDGAAGYKDLYPQPPAGGENPPGVIGPTPGYIGTRQSVEVLKIITGCGEVLSGKLLVVDLLNNCDTVFTI
ncbi:HesA/MoeB/ThiF family protein [Marinilabiliaceae bacterium ANBcel2]|nr:HesA/MoeB/ThiF family protein [Marinilabiliaceae bacterium ANBcel2]